MRTRARIAWLALFATAMGWLEAVVVVYLRAILGLGRGESMPTAAGVMERFARFPWLLSIEQGRELATMVMLAAVAWIGAERPSARFGAWLMIFGIWDIAYYVGLFAMVDWPRSLTAMDLLFLIPASPWWYQPIWHPVGMSCLMIAGGAWLQGPRA
jgi:hypothetical protein